MNKLHPEIQSAVDNLLSKGWAATGTNGKGQALYSRTEDQGIISFGIPKQLTLSDAMVIQNCIETLQRKQP